MLRQVTPTTHSEKETQRHGISFVTRKRIKDGTGKRRSFHVLKNMLGKMPHSGPRKGRPPPKLPLAGTSLRLFIYASSSNIFHGGPFTGVSLSSLYPNIVLIPLPCNSRRGRALPRLHGRRPRARRRVATVTAAPWR